MKPLFQDNKLFKHSFTFFSNKKKHLSSLLADEKRFENFSRSGAGIFYDFSRQLLDDKALEFLFDLSREKQVLQKFKAMTNGKIVNKTEQRPALHTLCRGTGKFDSLEKEIKRVHEEVKEFCENIHKGLIKTSGNKNFTDICVIGIGGSNLGTEFVIRSLENQKKLLKPHFIRSCDPNEFIRFNNCADIKTTLFIIISKSYTTREVLINETFLKKALDENNLDYKKHVVRITAKNSPGDKTDSGIKTFHMFDSIGGRYSVSSAVGDLPVSLVYGTKTFEDFLLGMNEFDEHVLNSSEKDNIALISALIDIWNSVYLNFSTLAIIPYSDLLEKLPAHIQQLYMESNGKTFCENCENEINSTSMVIFGETGTKSQHSFFQLFHQGRVTPIEFIGILEPPQHDLPLYDEITGHDELWANLLAQADALANGRDSDLAYKRCSGNRPSTIITIESISPKNIGRLVSFYEARTVLAGFLWGINPFDQFGVELGKKLANEKRGMITNTLAQQKKGSLNPADDFYCKAISKRKLY